VALAQIAVHMCADRARLEDDPTRAAATSRIAAFVENLVDMVTGALFAPLSAASRDRNRRTRRWTDDNWAE